MAVSYTHLQDKELAQETKADDVYQTEITTALGQNISRQLFVFDEGTYFYSNTIGDETMFSVDSDLISEEMWTKEEQKFVQSRIDDAEEIFKNLGDVYKRQVRRSMHLQCWQAGYYP